MARNYDIENEIAEGFYWDDQERLFTAMRNRGLTEENQQSVLAKIVDRWDATDRAEYLVEFICQEGVGIELAEAIVVDDMLATRDEQGPIFTLEFIQEHYGIGLTYNPIQMEAQG